MSPLAMRRELTAAEQHIDVEGLVAALEAAKLALHTEIVKEQRRVARASARGRRSPLVVTPRMASILRGLYEHGRRAAHAEARSMGVPLRRAYEAEAAPPRPGTERGYARLRLLLGQLAHRVHTEGLALLDIRADSRPEMVRALTRIPGALDAAGRVVSMTLFSGLGDVFAANADAFGGWEASAILDGGTCGPCEENDGHFYPTWEAAMDDLPDGGPYVQCDGGDRCRCRLVPLPPA